MKSLIHLAPLLLIISPFSACMVPDRNFPKPGEDGGEGGDGPVDSSSGGRKNDPETGDEGSGGTSTSSGGRNDTSSGGTLHEPGTPLLLVAPEELETPLIWNTRVDFSFGLEAAAEGVSWSIIDGELPQGLSLSADGQLKGRAQELGEFSVTILATNGDDEGELEVEFTVESRSWIAYLLVDHDNDSARLFAADLSATSPSPVEIEEAQIAARFGTISFSPDGRSLVYLIDEDGDPADCDVRIARLDGDASPTAKAMGSAKARCDEPFRWSPDGSSFVHLRLSSSNSLVPVLVRTRSSGESYFIFSNQSSTSATGIEWASDDLVLYNKTLGSPPLALDVADEALENPRALGTAQSTTYLNPDEARFAGPVGDTLEVIDADDDWSVTFSTTSRAVSPGLNYTVLRENDTTLHVHAVDAFDITDPEPIMLIQREVGATSGVPWVFFSGKADQVLTGYSTYVDPNGQDGYRLWEMNVNGQGDPTEFEFPLNCAPTRLAPSGWIYCETTETGLARSYAHRPGFDDLVHPTVGDPAMDTLRHPPVVEPDHSGILQTWGDTESATTGVFRFGFSDDSATPGSVRLSPDQDPDAVTVMTEAARRPVWTGDGAFAAFVMSRPSGSLNSSAVWARRVRVASTPVNVSTSNAACTGTTAQNDCLEITQLVSQPAMPAGK